jgi:hypothetical protein
LNGGWINGRAAVTMRVARCRRLVAWLGATRMLVGELQVLVGVSFEFRFATGAAEQDILACMAQPVRRVGIWRHAADRIPVPRRRAVMAVLMVFAMHDHNSLARTLAPLSSLELDPEPSHNGKVNRENS